MAVQDVSLSESEGFVSRLEGAKKLAERFLSIKPETVETGIVTFSRLPTLILPFTTDSMLSKNTIVGIAPLIYGGGSNLVNVVNMIDEVYGNVPNLHVVILSDGEFFDLKNVSSFKNRSAKITLVGVGTENGGHMLEWYDSVGKPRYRSDASGRIVSKRDSAMLRTLSKNLWGEVFFLDNLSQLDDILGNFSASNGTESPAGSRWLMIFGALLVGVFVFLLPYSSYPHAK